MSKLTKNTKMNIIFPNASNNDHMIFLTKCMNYCSKTYNIEQHEQQYEQKTKVLHYSTCIHNCASIFINAPTKHQ